jgi:hypothetical protein
MSNCLSQFLAAAADDSALTTTLVSVQMTNADLVGILGRGVGRRAFEPTAPLPFTGSLAYNNAQSVFYGPINGKIDIRAYPGYIETYTMKLRCSSALIR